MAVFKFVQVAPAGNGGANTLYAGTLASGGTSGVVTPGSGQIVRVAVSDHATIRFGAATLSAPSGSDMLLTPYGVEEFDMGVNTSLDIYAFNAGTYVTVSVVSKN